MTKSAVKRMIKQAKETALDKAMTAAEQAGKPTSTGIVTGAGLGAILAAMGALKRSGEDPSKVSFLSNPLLLGTLGAAGGYLAGNSFERAKPKRNNKELSLSALAGLTGGTGIIGSLLAKEDADALVNKRRAELQNILDKHRNSGSPILERTQNGIKQYDLDNKLVTKGKGRKARIALKPANRPTKDIIEFRNALENLSVAHRRAGNTIENIIETGYGTPDGVRSGSRFMEWLRNSRYSPYSWMRSLNPFKNPLESTVKSERGLGLLGKQLSNVAKKHKYLTGLAGLSLLAGGGKAIYDYARD